MKIPNIGDVMNKFEVLGIVGEGEIAHLLALHNVVLWNIQAKRVVKPEQMILSASTELSQCLIYIFQQLEIA